MTDTFGNNPVTIGTPVGTPVGTAYVPNTPNGDLTPIEGIAINTDSGSPPRKSTAIRLGILDGDDVAQGLKSDVAIVGDNPGTISGKLRGLTKIFNDVWDSVNHRLHVSVDNATALGQATMVNSSPVVIASDQSPVAVKSGFTSVTGNAITTSAVLTGATPVAGADLITQMDVSAYKWASVQLLGTWNCIFTIQGSLTNADWVSLLGWQIGGTAGAAVTTLTVNGIFYFPIQTQYMRIRAGTFTSNTSLTSVLNLYTEPPAALQQIWAAISGTWTVQPGNTVNTTPWLTARSNNNAVQAAGGGLTVVKASPGLLDSAMVTATGTVGLTVYDNASAASGTPLLVIPANPVVGTRFPVEGWAKLGITSGGVANCPAVTFFYS